MINTIGNLTDTTEKANEISDKIKHEFMKLEALIKPKELKSAAYVIWNKPLMVAGKNTFIDDILFRCKLTNVFNKQRYPETSMDELTELSPEVILLSSEPFPFKQKHLELFKENCKNSKILLVDGEMFSWYGSRLQYAPEYFKKILATIH
jgi:ABC-type Fe3+-hydroxamate transport system substrate-binding protein